MPSWGRFGTVTDSGRTRFGVRADEGFAACITQIYEGTNEIQRVVMARQLLRGM